MNKNCEKKRKKKNVECGVANEFPWDNPLYP